MWYISILMTGSQIIDVVILVVDVTKGFQTQTAECLVIGEITCKKMLVVLNKCDLLDIDQRCELIQKVFRLFMIILPKDEKAYLKNSGKYNFQTVKNRRNFSCPWWYSGRVKVEFTSEQRTNNSQEIENLITLLAQSISDPTENRNKLKDRSFIFAVDHCFTITGQGTILTGTVLSGTTSVGQGDRAGICVPQLDANLLERGLVGDITSTNNLTPCYACILSCVRKVSYFKSSIKSKSRLHIFVGQETVLANLTFFTKVKSEHDNANNTEKSFEFDKTAMYHYVEEIPNVTDDNLYLLLEFEHHVICPMNGLVIGAKLDTYAVNSCRIALHGHVITQLNDLNYKSNNLSKLLVCKSKTRRGQIERVVNPRMCIVHGLFKRETNWEIFVGLRAYVIIKLNETNSTETQRINGYIESSFGQSGKCRLALDSDLPDEILAQYSSKGGRKQVSQPDTEVVLEFKKNVFDPQRRIIQ
ncbi:Selenocysteine-specific elongation factor [Schistosoma japonicum]|nr:Selenocysteine-specific elongation factor [Schistosoma japonicum]